MYAGINISAARNATRGQDLAAEIQAVLAEQEAAARSGQPEDGGGRATASRPGTGDTASPLQAKAQVTQLISSLDAPLPGYGELPTARRRPLPEALPDAVELSRTENRPATASREQPPAASLVLALASNQPAAASATPGASAHRAVAAYSRTARLKDTLPH